MSNLELRFRRYMSILPVMENMILLQVLLEQMKQKLLFRISKIKLKVNATLLLLTLILTTFNREQKPSLIRYSIQHWIV